MKVGSIVFGPQASPHEHQYWRNQLNASAVTVAGVGQQSCNCIGPQPGETKCPCVLRGEAEMGRKMVDDGVTINGKRYRLVPDHQ